MKNKILCSAIILPLLFISMLLCTNTAYANKTDLQPINIQEVSYPDIEGVDGATWDSVTKTLTIENCNYDANSIKWPNSKVFLFVESQPINVVVKGENNFNLRSNGDVLFWSSNINDLNISGDGVINVSNAGNVIRNFNNVNIKQCTFNIDDTSHNSFDINGVFDLDKSAKINCKQRYYYSWIISANKTINEPSSFGNLFGRLGYGAKFIVDKNEWKVNTQGNYTNISLVKYGSSSKSINLSNATLNGHTYRVTEICSNAFKNSNITKIRIGGFVKKIGANAFYNTKKLTNLGFCTSSNYKNLTYYPQQLAKLSGTYKTGHKLTFNNGVNKKAFAKMGKSNGSKLVVHTSNDDKKPWKNNTALKKAMMKKGAQSKIQVKK